MDTDQIIQKNNNDHREGKIEVENLTSKELIEVMEQCKNISFKEE
jgi:hypothetical protein